MPPDATDGASRDARLKLIAELNQRKQDLRTELRRTNARLHHEQTALGRDSRARPRAREAFSESSLEGEHQELRISSPSRREYALPPVNDQTLAYLVDVYRTATGAAVLTKKQTGKLVVGYRVLGPQFLRRLELLHRARQSTDDLMELALHDDWETYLQPDAPAAPTESALDAAPSNDPPPLAASERPCRLHPPSAWAERPAGGWYCAVCHPTR